VVVWTIVGCVAAVVAAAGTWLAYRAAVPKVSVRASVSTFGPHEGSLVVDVLNGGNAETTIDFEGIVFKRTPGFAPAEMATGLKPIDRFMHLTLSGALHARVPLARAISRSYSPSVSGVV
jgi:hypothetical protein